MKRDILELARLFRCLESGDCVEMKAKEIKYVRDNGHITEDEALTLALEYCTRVYDSTKRLIAEKMKGA